jgi:hypothetical protein
MRSRVVATMACGILFLAGLHEQTCWAAGEQAKTPGTPAAAQAPKTGWDAAMDTFHHPTDSLDLGADVRVRNEYGENIRTVDESGAYNYTDWTRYRARVWAKVKADKDLDFNARLIDEFRTWYNFPSATQPDDNYDEILFDNFNVTARQVGGMPLNVVVGRQDIMLGENWLVLDGTPLDGSRTQFLDAVRATFDWKEQKTKLDLIYIDMAASTDRWLKPIHDRNRYLTEQDEQGGIAYLTYKPTATKQIEGYFIYLDENPLTFTATNMPLAWTSDATIYTFGGAFSGQTGDHWSYRTEWAYQTGERNDNDIQAYGTNNRLTYAFKDDYQNSVRIGYEYISGDDPSTADDERFDMLWGEWPRWSELYIYTYIKEGQVAQNSNLHRIGVGHTFNPTKKLQVQSDYMALWADENIVKAGFSANDNFRGHLLTCWLKYTYSPQIKGHLLGEYLIPGGYYTTQDNAVFLRAQVEFTF